jgi:DNA-3-methyladenine glycosylase I
VFQAGISWSVIEAKWEGMREAFDEFDPEKIAAYTPDDIERLMSDPGVVHNRKKIEATVHNAGELIVVDRDYHGFDNYLRLFEDNEDLVRDLHRRFRFLGESTAHFFLYSIGFNVRAQDEWAHRHFEGTQHQHHRR